MRQDRDIYLGIDVGKAQCVCALDNRLAGMPLTAPSLTQLPVLEFFNAPAGVRQLKAWLRAQRPMLRKAGGRATLRFHFVMEATGCYSAMLAEALRRSFPHAEVVIVNPRTVQAFRRSVPVGNKTDQLDAQCLACFGTERRPVPAPALAPNYQTLRNWTRERARLVRIGTMLKNLAETLRDPELLRIHRQEACEQQQMCAVIQRRIAALVAADPELQRQAELIKTVPYAGDVFAWTWLGALGQPGRFHSSRAVARFTGTNPVEEFSGTSVHRTHMSHEGDALLRQLLYTSCLGAVRRIPLLLALYQRLIHRGKTPMQARVACMRKYAMIVYAVQKSQQPYHEVQVPAEKMQKKCQKSTASA